MASIRRSYVLNRTAVLKILLHAFKYPTTGVSGFLLGIEGPVDGDTDPTSDRRVVHVVDAVPVMHTFLTLTPSLEAALAQLRVHCSQANSRAISVVGYYQCNEQLSDSELNQTSKRVAEKIESLFPGCVALTLDGNALKRMLEGPDDGAGPPLFRHFAKDSAKGWTSSASTKLECPSAGLADLLSRYVAEGRHRKLADFEDYLEDVEADWLNADITA